MLWAALLSLVFPGLGHVYARRWTIGAVLLTLDVVIQGGWRFASERLEPLPIVVFAVFAAIGLEVMFRVISAAHAVIQIPGRASLPRPSRLYSTWYAAFLILVINAAVVRYIPAGWETYYSASSSSLPALAACDSVIADIREDREPIERGDLVVFQYTSPNAGVLIKRVVGLPGDRIQLREGHLIINGVSVTRQPAGEVAVTSDGVRTLLHRYVEILPNGQQHYILKATDTGTLNDTPEYHVPPGRIFVLGDNRDNSLDSRLPIGGAGEGSVPLTNVMGKLETVVWSCDASRILMRVQ